MDKNNMLSANFLFDLSKTVGGHPEIIKRHREYDNPIFIQNVNLGKADCKTPIWKSKDKCI